MCSNGHFTHFTHFTSHFTAGNAFGPKELRPAGEMGEVTFPSSTRAGVEFTVHNTSVEKGVLPKSLHPFHRLPPSLHWATGSPGEVTGEVGGVGEVTSAREGS